MVFTEKEDEERWQFFEQLMTGCSEEFLTKAGHFFYNQAKIRLVAMPWEVHDPKSFFGANKNEFASASTSPNLTLGDVVKKKASKKNANKWIPILDAPLVKSKAYDPVALKLSKGMTIQYAPKSYKNISVACEAIINGFTKYHVKVTDAATNKSGTITYAQVIAVLVT